MNWVDVILVIVLAFFVAEGVRVGFWASLANFLAFTAALVISLKLFKLVSPVLRSSFSLPHSLANALSFLAVAVILEAILSYVFWILIERIPLKVWKAKTNKVLGSIPSFGEGVVIIAFVLTLVMSLPIAGSLKRDITESRLGSEAVGRTSLMESKFEEVFGGVIRDTLTSLTVKQASRESVSLNVEANNLKTDEVSEAGMFALVNKERENIGLHVLGWRGELLPVARAHALDMWERSYFGHYSPEGKNMGDRLKEAGVGYLLAGENLALAPTEESAHAGLMNSTGHRENILNPGFKRVAIGAIDNGVYGKIFVQIFTD
ncbi:MAG: hypothetical protein ACD_52C00256G0003 [uncultured bacterium]|uniref:SCP domain-containing protein n=1 Tax=Candidatus Woesebacteria bacterium RIFCSPHIGHO2_12_FULL_41_24 TaxID=1802510 RepID=A0A1F8AQP2_9BACT|nr:MAG: hypothetical protein ACD_52C00256G0003 [uncultured bacterium]OGM15095.1 MAG: hypothetical protein A2W15_06340 [Candidatus Woesebacteria bacterium RBG_16_41_13]OGM28668.1 MAG: hypothetical protein A2873_05625 [Candidatus Woesebacteria bacterium RIFCSPHIGHO2_01_FULL_42_80]OGM34454.1 MAG: hypothetical protein A3D84_04555 [Candidatus Woesebacteria bacterium RIFCSPHIGHO2_02_FULL_42_20]OGM54092.1 MAG: hypothetical protein A3E44_02710 [Candidatus Woesebacteria bacterium RIFCSPHIGHO2_12_FULL_41